MNAVRGHTAKPSANVRKPGSVAEKVLKGSNKWNETMREFILDGLKRTSQESHAHLEEQAKALGKAMASLSHAKLDRTVLAKLFNESAARLVDH